MNIIIGLFTAACLIAAAATLIASAYLAGRWTQQPWLSGLAVALVLTPPVFGITDRAITHSFEYGGWFANHFDTAGSILSMLKAAEYLVFAATVAALVLLSARRARHPAE